jgi:hypothetical protein
VADEPIKDPPEPDPLAALSPEHRFLRWAIRISAAALIVLTFVAFATAWVSVSGLLIRSGSGGTADITDESRAAIASLTWAPKTSVVTLIAAVLALVALVVLIRLASRRADHASDAMTADYLVRVKAVRRRGPPPPEGKLQQVVPGVTIIGCLIVGWFAGPVVFSSSPSSSLAGLLEHAAIAIWGALLAGLILTVVYPALGLAWGLGGVLVGWLAGPLGIHRDLLRALKKLGQDEAEAEALRRWPPPAGPHLILNAAVSVLSAPIGRQRRRRERNLVVPWTGEQTSVETLASTLLAVAILECRQRDLVTCQVVRRRLHLVGKRPKQLIPEGLADIVVGRPQIGFQQGHEVNGTLKTVLRAWPKLRWGDEDPHWVIVETALSDLSQLGIYTQGRMIELAKLREAAAHVAPLRQLHALVSSDPAFFARLLRECDAALRGVETTDIDPNPKFFAAMSALVRPRITRARHKLPEAAATVPHGDK